MKLILLAMLTAACYSQTVINVPAVNCNKACTDALALEMGRISSGVESTLETGIGPAATSITVAVAEWTPPVSAVLSIGGGEHVRVTAKTGLKVLTITRGVNGTTATAHAAGALVMDLQFRTFDGYAKAILIKGLRRSVSEDARSNAAIKVAQTQKDADVSTSVQ